MTTQTPRPAADSDGKEAASADAAGSQPGPIAISPAIGPLPAIYVPPAPGEPSPVGLLRHLTARVARLAGRWGHAPSAASPPCNPDGAPRQPATHPSAMRAVPLGGNSVRYPS
jgi:hypothetical protein